MLMPIDLIFVGGCAMQVTGHLQSQNPETFISFFGNIFLRLKRTPVFQLRVRAVLATPPPHTRTHTLISFLFEKSHKTKSVRKNRERTSWRKMY